MNEFEKAEREYIEATFQPLSTSPQERVLTEGQIASTSQTAVGLLTALLGWFKKPNKDEAVGLRIATKLDELASYEGDAVRRHFAYHAILEWYYRFREQLPNALECAILACEKQIGIATQAAAGFRETSDILPLHRGYEQLAIILEKQGRFGEAIELSRRALDEGWGAGWEARIARNRKKLEKQANVRRQ